MLNESNSHISVNKNWYRNFFNGLAEELWVHAIPEVYTGQEINFIIQAFGIKPGDKALDLFCGYGRHSLPLARMGYQVSATDISESAIQNIKEATAKEALDIFAVQGAFLDVNIAGIHDCAIWMGNSFGYSPREEMKQMLKKLAHLLRPGAGLVINTGTLAESILLNLKSTHWVEAGGIRMLIKNTYLEAVGALHAELILLKGAQEERKEFYHWVFTLSEVKAMLEEAGFTKVMAYKDLNGNVYKLGDGQAYITAVRS